MAFLGGLFGGGGQQNQSPQGGGRLPEGFQHAPRFGSNVEGALDQLLKMSMSGIQQGQGGFQPIKDQAMSDFHNKTVPTISERFTSMGGAGGQSGSGFAQAIGGAGADLEGQLAAMQGQYNQQQQGQLQNLLQMGLTPRNETTFQQQDPGFMQSFGGPMAQGIGSLLPLLLSGGLGGLGGMASGIGSAVGGLGNFASSMFGGNKQQASNQTGGIFR